MDQKFLEQLAEILPEKNIYINEPMNKHTTFRIGGSADVLVTPGVSETAEVLRLCKNHDIPVTIIGNGSNLLVGDQGIRGVVIEFGRPAEEIVIQGEQMHVTAGTMLSKAANEAAANGLSGLEFAAGIPGTVGGAVVMNAGAYGGEMKDVIRTVTVLTKEGEKQILTLEELDLGYRHSCIPENNYIVLSAELSLQKADTEQIRTVMADLRERRVTKQPLEYPSAGSTFKRPEGYFAGKLIQDAGLRGYQVGGAQVSEKHCGFVINRGDATARDVRQLITDVQKKVYEEFHVQIEPEVKMIGEF